MVLLRLKVIGGGELIGIVAAILLGGPLKTASKRLSSPPRLTLIVYLPIQFPLLTAHSRLQYVAMTFKMAVHSFLRTRKALNIQANPAS